MENKFEVGYIVFGYPGIGKSTLVKEHGYKGKFIDLESSNFNNKDGVKPDFWYNYYGNIAIDLAKQGNVIFVSTHERVMTYICNSIKEQKLSNIKLLIIAPSLLMEGEWINRLTERFKQDPSVKNEKALERAKNYYETDIFALQEFHQNHKEVDMISLMVSNYDLIKIIGNFCDIEVDPSKLFSKMKEFIEKHKDLV